MAASLVSLPIDLLNLVIGGAIDDHDPASLAHLALSCRVISLLEGNGIHHSHRYDAALRRAIATHANNNRYVEIERGGRVVTLTINAATTMQRRQIAQAYVELIHERQRAVQFQYTSVRGDIDWHICVQYGACQVCVLQDADEMIVKHVWTGGDNASSQHSHVLSRECALEAHLVVTSAYAHRLRDLVNDV